MSDITLPQVYRCKWCGNKLSSKDALCTKPGCPGSILATSTVTVKDSSNTKING